MSLINDALKQIKQTRQPDPPPNPPALSPVESNPPGKFGLLVPGLIILLLAGTVIFIGVSLSRPTPMAGRSMPAMTRVAPLNPPVNRRMPPAIVSSTVTQQLMRVSVAPPAIASTGLTATVMSSPAPAELKLQGILFAATRPCAIVNGRTVFAGDQVNGFRVAKISRDSITLQNRLETRVLSLNSR